MNTAIPPVVLYMIELADEYNKTLYETCCLIQRRHRSLLWPLNGDICFPARDGIMLRAVSAVHNTYHLTSKDIQFEYDLPFLGLITAVNYKGSKYKL